MKDKNISNKKELIFTEEQQAYLDDMQKQHKKEMFTNQMIFIAVISITAAAGGYLFTDKLSTTLTKIYEATTNEVKEDNPKKGPNLIKS